MGKRLDRMPVKAEMGSWNFIMTEFREEQGKGMTMWLCYCDCLRSTRWIQPSTLEPSSLCRHCANENSSKIYKKGKELLETPEKVEVVAPAGQLSLDSLPKEPVPLEIKDPVKEGTDDLLEKEGLLGRKMYIYVFCNVDYNWELLPTVKDYLQDNLFKEQLATMGLKTTDGDFYKTLYLGLESALSIAAALERCLEYAEENLDWDNTFYEEPRIFFVPVVGMSCGFNYGFAWKIFNNGAAYIVSPIERPDIEENYCADKGVLNV